VIYTSEDGGVTWQEAGRAGPVGSVEGVVRGKALVATYPASLAKPDVWLVPGMEPVTRPEEAAHPLTASGLLFWATEDGRLLLEGGEEVVRLPLEGYDSIDISSVWGQISTLLEKGEAVVRWSRSRAAVGESDWHLTTFSVTQGIFRQESDIAMDALYSLRGAYQPKDGRFYVSVDLPRDVRPAPADGIGWPVVTVIDMLTGELRVIETGYELGRNLVVAVQTGPLARVAGTGSCLNVRAGPSLTADVLGCVADGVLLRPTGQATDADGITWALVTTPKGEGGWVSTNFIER
jgi:hypothetical protein